MDQVIGMLCAEDQGQTRTASYVGEVKCPECNKGGHTSASCWELHPEKAPVCKNCGTKGHIARSCPSKRSSTDVAITDDFFGDQAMPIAL